MIMCIYIYDYTYTYYIYIYIHMCIYILHPLPTGPSPQYIAAPCSPQSKQVTSLRGDAA